MAECECPKCHRVFGGVRGFDDHQRADYTRRPAITCLDPADLGMVLDARGVWVRQTTDRGRAQVAKWCEDRMQRKEKS